MSQQIVVGLTFTQNILLLVNFHFTIKTTNKQKKAESMKTSKQVRKKKLKQPNTTTLKVSVIPSADSLNVNYTKATENITTGQAKTLTNPRSLHLVEYFKG